MAKKQVSSLARWHMQNLDIRIGVEAAYTAEGLKRLQQIRRTDPRFKRRRITNVFQVKPEDVPLKDGVVSNVYNLT